MNMEAIIKPCREIKFTGLKKMKLTPSCACSFTKFQEFCGYWGIWNVFALIKWMFCLELVQWEKEESKDDLESQKTWDNKTQSCVLVCLYVCVCVHGHASWGREKAVGNKFEKYFNFLK